MSLFEKLNNKRYDLQERTKKFPPKDEGSSNNNTRTKNSQRNIKKELIFDPSKKEASKNF